MTAMTAKNGIASWANVTAAHPNSPINTCLTDNGAASMASKFRCQVILLMIG
jgi:hypothetical protein